MKIVIKFGGSVITKKDTTDFPLRVEAIKRCGTNFVQEDVIRRLGREIIEFMKEKEFQLILVNGAGPFGHFLVKKFLEGVKIKPKTIHSSVKFLNSLLVKFLREEGLKIKSISPYSNCFKIGTTFDISKLWKKIRKLLKENIIPSLYGDIVKCKKCEGLLGKSDVISGDDLAILSALKWKADKIIMVSDVDGVFEKDPEKSVNTKIIKTLKSNHNISFGKRKYDVTGGMRRKVEKLLFVAKKGINSRIINGLKPGVLLKALRGEDVGTLITS